MQQTVKQRLVQYLKHIGIGQNKFEEKAGIATGYISHLQNTPGPQQLAKILNAAPNLNRVWLLSGDGEMLNSDVSQVAVSQMEEYTTTKNGVKFLKKQDGKLVMEVPIVPIEVLGSPSDEYATIINDGTAEKTLFEVDSVHHGKYYAFRVNGDSMDDGTRRSFERGDIVLVRELDRDEWMPRLRFNDWPFWVVVFGNNVRIKQIIRQNEETGAITLHSLNPSPEYTDFTLQLSQISRLFNVVQHIPHPNKF